MSEDDITFPQTLEVVATTDDPDDPESVGLSYKTNDIEHLPVLIGELLVALHKEHGAAYVEQIMGHYLHRIGYSGGDLPSQQKPKDLQA